MLKNIIVSLLMIFLCSCINNEQGILISQDNEKSVKSFDTISNLNSTFKINEIQNSILTIEASFDKPLNTLDFSANEVLIQNPQKNDNDGKNWIYKIDLNKVGSCGENKKGKWAILNIFLALPKAILEPSNLPLIKFEGSNIPIFKQFPQILMIGNGWNYSKLETSIGSTDLYFTETDKQQILTKMILGMDEALVKWRIPLPEKYPSIITFTHNKVNEPTIFSGVNMGKVFEFTTPQNTLDKNYVFYGLPVLAHEMLHNYTGKGQFKAPVRITSNDSIIKEGFITYAGLIIAKYSGLFSQKDFDTYLNNVFIEKEKAVKTRMSLIPRQEEQNDWIRLSYFRGAIFCHKLTLALGGLDKFPDLFKALLKVNSDFKAEDLQEIILKNFNLDISSISKKYLFDNEPKY